MNKLICIQSQYQSTLSFVGRVCRKFIYGAHLKLSIDISHCEEHLRPHKTKAHLPFFHWLSWMGIDGEEDCLQPNICSPNSYPMYIACLHRQDQPPYQILGWRGFRLRFWRVRINLNFLFLWCGLSRNTHPVIFFNKPENSSYFVVTWSGIFILFM